MGVPELLRAIAITLGVKKITLDVFENITVDCLYFDLASLMHIAAQDTYAYGNYFDEQKQQDLAQYSDKELMQRLYDNVGLRIAHAVRTATPKKLVYIAMDGVPVYAKSVQQRWRRFAATPSLLFDSNSITPGTKFMDDFSDWLRQWIATFSRTYKEADFFLTDHTVPGEAEHKIAAEIRRHSSWCHVIHGLDTDLFLISLLLTPKVYLWNEKPIDVHITEDEHLTATREVDKHYKERRIRKSPNEFPQIVDIDAAKTIIAKRICTTNSLASFVAGTMILGNDFIPRNKSLEDFVASLHVIIDALREGDIATTTKSPDNTITDIRVLWKPFMKFLLSVASHENHLIVSAAQRTSNPLVSKATEGVTFHYDRYAKMYREDVARRDPVNIDTNAVVTRYIEMIAFVLVYYGVGTHAVNKRLYYDYYYAPLLTDLARIAPTVVVSVAQKKVWLTGDEGFLNPYHHLIAVLPQRSFYLLPRVVARSLAEKITHDRSWSQLYPNKVDRDIDGYAVEHVGPVFVPFMIPSVAESLSVPEFILFPEAQYFTHSIDTNAPDDIPEIQW